MEASMKNDARYLIWTTALLLILGLTLDAISDDGPYRKRHRYRGGSQQADDYVGHHDRSDLVKLVTDQAYNETCGGCHFAYQPELLASASWLKILDQLDNHFGEEIEADPETLKTITAYLKTNAAENSSSKLSKKIMRSLGNLMPTRITDIPYIRRKHHELDQEVFKRKSIGSLANCTACHLTAGKGIYDDDDVQIPK
jgi:hypothetical protein